MQEDSIIKRLTVTVYSDGVSIKGRSLFRNKLLAFVINNEAFIRPDLDHDVQDTLRSWLIGKRIHQPIERTGYVFDQLERGRITRQEAVYRIVLVKVRSIIDTWEPEEASARLYELWVNA